MGLVRRLKGLVDNETKSRIKSAFVAPLPLDVGRKRAGRIVMYHGVDAEGRTTFNKRFFSAASFGLHLRYYRDHFEVVPLSQFFEEGAGRGRFRIAITFDDGYENNYRRALPLLEQYKLPATIFVTGMATEEPNILWSDFLDIAQTLTAAPVEIRGTCFRKGPGGAYRNSNGETLADVIRAKGGYDFKREMMEAFMKHTGDFRGREELRDYFRLMSEEQIRALAGSPYVEIGSHGFFHNNLGNIPLADATREIKKSKDYLESLVDGPVESIAYPDGSYTRELVEAAAGLGYRRQLAVKYQDVADVTDDRLRDRFGLYPELGASTKYLAYRITRS